jgi:NitT/TauT family transport system substrate-binding protein
VTGRRSSLALAAACVLCVHACTSPNTRPAKPGRVTLRVLLLPSLSSAPLFIAADDGYFAGQGLGVEFVKITRSADALVALAQGELDVWTGSVSFALMNAIARDDRIRVVSDKGYFDAAGCAYGALMVRRTLVETGAVDQPGKLRGRRVAFNASASPGFFMETYLGQAGLALESVQPADIPDGAVVAEALRTGSVDAAFVLEPWVTQIQRTGTAVPFASAGRVLPGYQHMVIAYGPSLLARDQGAGRRFMAAYLGAVRQYNQGKTARNSEILARNTGLDAALLQEACWPAMRGDGRVDQASLADFQRWGLRRGLLDRALLPGRYWDSTFVDSAAGLGR